MILTTTSVIQGKRRSVNTRASSRARRLSARISSGTFSPAFAILSEDAGAYEKELQKAREIALKEMTDSARSQGANAVVGIDLDYEVVGKNGSMLMVTTCGTAVTI